MRDSNKIQKIGGYYREIWLSLKITEMSKFSVMHCWENDLSNKSHYKILCIYLAATCVHVVSCGSAALTVIFFLGDDRWSRKKINKKEEKYFRKL